MFRYITIIFYFFTTTNLQFREYNCYSIKAVFKAIVCTLIIKDYVLKNIGISISQNIRIFEWPWSHWPSLDEIELVKRNLFI